VTDIGLLTGCLLVFGGVFAGYVNAVAGGGSALTIPLFMYCGLDASLANGTNRVSVGIQAISANLSFKKAGVSTDKTVFWPMLWVITGSTVGACIAVSLSSSFLNIVFSVIFLVLAAIIARGPGLLKPPDHSAAGHPLMAVVSYLFIGAYGGAFQAGVGVPLLLALVQLGGLDVVKGNAFKTLIIFVYTGLVLLIFSGVGQVVWLPGLLVGLGGVFGSVIGAKHVISKGSNLVRWVVIIILSISGFRGLWIALSA